MLRLVRWLLVLTGVSLAAYYALVHYVGSTRITFNDKIISVPAGSSAALLCRQWVQQQLVSDANCIALKVYLRLHPSQAKVQQGVYRVAPDTAILDLLALLRSGKEAQFAIALIEGETVQQSLQRIAQAEYLVNDVQTIEQLHNLTTWPDAWGERPSNAEAMLFPDTYYYTANSKASDLVKRSQNALLQQLDLAWQQRQHDLPLENPYQLLILASIIEKESSYPPEKNLVASVFVNRLRKNMRLQTDPTVIYGLDNFNGNITRADLNNPHPYNTYRHKGLPPGPISLVSQASLLAAANPAETDLYYFVAKGDGTHQFSSTLQQHNAAVKQYIFGAKP